MDTSARITNLFSIRLQRPKIIPIYSCFLILFELRLLFWYNHWQAINACKEQPRFFATQIIERQIQIKMIRLSHFRGIDMTDSNEFKKRVYDIVNDIPAGFVLTYGAIALLAGRPGNSRMVGKLMSMAPRDTSSHRVVNHIGRTVFGWAEQRELLEHDGITFKENGCVDLKKHLWRSF